LRQIPAAKWAKNAWIFVGNTVRNGQLWKVVQMRKREKPGRAEAQSTVIIPGESFSGDGIKEERAIQFGSGRPALNALDGVFDTPSKALQQPFRAPLQADCPTNVRFSRRRDHPIDTGSRRNVTARLPG
jgi:translation elongation factor EF-1alpha